MPNYYSRDNDNIGQNLLNMTGAFLNQYQGLTNFLDQQNNRARQQASLNKLMKRAKEAGDINSLSFNDIDNIDDLRAMGTLLQQNSQNQQNRLEGMKRREAADMEFYNQKLFPAMSLLQKAYENKDWNSFDELTQQTFNMLGTPYRGKPSGDGNTFDIYFRSDKNMGFTPTGQKMTRDEIYKIVKDMVDGTHFVPAGITGQKIAYNPDFHLWSEKNRQATARGNIENDFNPKPMLGPDGQTYYASVQNQWGNYNAEPDVILFNANGQKVGVFGAGNLAQRGFKWGTQVLDSETGQVKYTIPGLQQGNGTGYRIDSQSKQPRQGKPIEMVGKNSPIHGRMIASGYFYDKDQNWYYEQDKNGEPDYSKPAPQELVFKLYQEYAQQRGIGQPAQSGSSGWDGKNNPGALMKPGAQKGSPANGQSFKNLEDGINASARQLRINATKHGLNTVRGQITRWSPPNENKTEQYINFISKKMGVNPDTPLDFNDVEVMSAMLEGIFAYEKTVKEKISREQIRSVLLGQRTNSQTRDPRITQNAQR